MTGPVAAAAGGTGAVDADNPWPGLLPFYEADWRYFRGRESEVDEVCRLIRRGRLTVLYGLSGLGKSSLVQAGVFPKLRADSYFPVYIRLAFSGEKPDLVWQVMEAIAREADAAKIEAPTPRSKETLWEYFHHNDADFWDLRNRPRIPLLVFDQFEELFTLGRQTAAASAASELFILELADLAAGDTPRSVQRRLAADGASADEFAFGRHAYKILLSIREDFLPEFDGLERIGALGVNSRRLYRMNGDAALLAVNQAPHLIDPDVADKVVRFVAASRLPDVRLKDLEVEPALLSLICRELNEKRKKAGQSKITAGLLEGNQAESLSIFYEDSFIGIRPEVRVFIEENLLNVEGFRDSEALVNVMKAPGVTRDAIERLIDRRLVRIENLRGERLELTHDLLTSVVRASRDERRALAAQTASEEARREEVRRQAADRAVQAARRDRLVAAALAFLLLIAIAFAYLAVGQQRIAREQSGIAEKQRRLAEERTSEARSAEKNATEAAALAMAANERTQLEKRRADTLRDQALVSKREADRQRGLADARADEAEKARNTAEAARVDAAKAAMRAQEAAADAVRERNEANTARENLRNKTAELGVSLARSDVQEAGRLLDLRSPREALAYLARALENDPNSLAARSFILDLLINGSSPVPGGNGSSAGSFERREIQAGSPVYSVVFSPDGRLLLAACADGTARIWDLATGRMRRIRAGKQLNFASFSPDGSMVATAAQSGAAQIWNTETEQALTSPLQHDGPVISVSFSHGLVRPRIVTASWDGTVRIWSVATGREDLRIAPLALLDGRPPTPREGTPLTSASFSADDQWVLISSWDNTAQIRDTARGGLEVTIVHNGQAGLRGWTPADQLNAAVFSADARLVATAASDGTARVWDWRAALPLGAALTHKSAVNCVAFSPDGLRVVTASDDGSARIWETQTGAPISSPLRTPFRVASAAFSPDGSRVATASLDGTVVLWAVPYGGAFGPEPLRDLAKLQGGYETSTLPQFTPFSEGARRDLLKSLARFASGNEPIAALVRSIISGQ